MKKFLAAAVMIGAMFTVPVFADNYVGVDYSRYDLDIDGFGNVDDINTISVRYGHMFNKFVGVELRVAKGNGDYLDLDHSASLLLKLTQPLSPQNSIYATAGWTTAKFSAADYSTTEDGASYGVGVDHKFDNTDLAIYIEYNRLIEEDGGDLSGPTIGVRWYF